MNGLQSLPQRDVHAPAKRPAPRGAWNIGQQDLERVLVIRDTLSMFEDAPGALSRKDDTVFMWWAVRAYMATRKGGPHAHADAVARHRAVEAAQAKATDYKEATRCAADSSGRPYVQASTPREDQVAD